MATVIKFTRHDGLPFYTSPDQITFATPSIENRDGTTVGTADGRYHELKDTLDQIVAAWKD